jgi:hypothetical protein
MTENTTNDAFEKWLDEVDVDELQARMRARKLVPMREHSVVQVFLLGAVVALAGVFAGSLSARGGRAELDRRGFRVDVEPP